jgi:predicted nucleic acid-binding protein
VTGIETRLAHCQGVLVDSNVLLDISTKDPVWGEWSRDMLLHLAERTILMINPIVYAEVSVRFDTVESLDAALPMQLVRREALPWEAAFLAGKCFAQYRKRGGARHSPLPDIYIGAHAAVARLGLLTRDASRYRTYFPTVEIFTPAIRRA